MLGIFIITINCGGAEKLLINLLQRSKKNVTLIINEEAKGFFERSIKSKKIKIVSLGSYKLPKNPFSRRFKKVFYWFYFAHCFNNICKKHHLQRVDVHLVAGLMSAAICKRFLNPRLNLNLSWHGGEVRWWPYHNNSICAKMLVKIKSSQYRCYKWAIKYFDSSIFFSETVLNGAKNAGVLKNLYQLIQPGIDVKKYTPEEKEPFSVTFAARLVRAKQPDLLIKIASDIITVFPNMRINILGKGKMKKELEDQVETLHLSRYIRFHGEVEDTSTFFNKTDIFFSLQRIANFGSIALFEAMSSGCCCIVTKTLEWKTFPENVVCFVDINNKKKIIEQIIQLLKDNKHKTLLAKNARNFIVKKYTDKIMVKKYFNFMYK